MEWRKTDALMPASAVMLGALLLVPWILSSRPEPVSLRVPGLDRAGDGAASSAPVIGEPPVAGQPVRGPGLPADVNQPVSDAPGWPWFRGPDLDGTVHSSRPLLRTWPEAGPTCKWTIELGEGYAGAAVGHGCVYVLDYDESAKADTLRCLSLSDGREVWRNHYPVELTRNHGISRTVPALWGSAVVTIGPRCHVACWDADTGQCRWLVDLSFKYRTMIPRWYTGQCPLIDQGRLIVAPAGTALMVALDLATGDEIWATENPHKWEMTHASIVPMTYKGHRTYVYCASGAVAGVAAEDGKLLWKSNQWTTHFATAPSPVILPRDRLFLSSGYDSKVGALIMQLEGPADAPQPSVIESLSPKQFNSEQQTPVLYDQHLYAVRKQGGGRLVCLGLDGSEKWNSGRDRFGHGPYLIADGLIFVLSNHGLLTMAELNSVEYRPLGQFQALQDGQDAWGPMALADGYLILRDMTRMTCLDVARRERATAATAPVQRLPASPTARWDRSVSRAGADMSAANSVLAAGRAVRHHFLHSEPQR